jgi:hypothetical protein
VLLAGSNKHLMVYDVNAARLSAEFSDTHLKPVHSIQFFKSSRFLTIQDYASNMFMTASPHNSLKLWDLRNCKVCRTFSQHLNRWAQFLYFFLGRMLLERKFRGVLGML